MIFALGYIAGIATSALLFAIVAATGTRSGIDAGARAIRRTARRIDESVVRLPIGRGFVELPPDDDEIARQEIIESNRALGKDTRISELL